ncbi:MAG TPA: PTS sugar transporter subunit IIA [Stellaceae bacterium]|nr:PTS sugar transporter subunit IIA [Stellaceae bacterium]
MKLTDFLERESIVLSLRAGNKGAVMNTLAKRAATRLKLPVEAVAAPLLAREALGSTGIGRGIALPHARITTLSRPFGLLARLEKPVDFAAIDDEPVDLVFLLLTPENAGREHLAALAAVSRVLRDGAVARRLRAARDAGEIYACFENA